MSKNFLENNQSYWPFLMLEVFLHAMKMQLFKISAVHKMDITTRAIRRHLLVYW